MAFPISQGVFLQDHRRPPEWQSKGEMLFVGPFEKGPVGVPTELRTLEQAQTLFGAAGNAAEAVTATALRHFFAQGGQRALALRVGLGIKATEAQNLPEFLTAEMVKQAAHLDPGPDVISGDGPEWGNAVVAAFDARHLRAALRALPPGRIEMMAAPVISGLGQADARRAYRCLHQICEENDIFLLLDPKRGMATDELGAAWFATFGLKDSTHAVALAPMLNEGSGSVPGGMGGAVVAPSGPVAGLLDRVACGGGTWAPPNGPQSSLIGLNTAGRTGTAGARASQTPCPYVNVVTDHTHGARFGPDGVFSLAGADAPRLRFLRVLRKTRLTLRHELNRLMSESAPLGRRSEARLIAEALLFQLWQDGAVCGDSPAQAFRVTTTEPEDATGAFTLCAGLALQASGRFLWETVHMS